MDEAEDGGLGEFPGLETKKVVVDVREGKVES